ncbi:MAG: hypothetical protein JNL88_05520 [Bacteroidia bacterium]|nr:hypothetical protein [Bacteroidia bacterium]
MKRDLSKTLFDRYFACKERHIDIELPGRMLQHVLIIGFFKGGDDSEDPYIIQWHVGSDCDAMQGGQDAWGLQTGEIIQHSDILRVRFEEDNTILEIK